METRGSLRAPAPRCANPNQHAVDAVDADAVAALDAYLHDKVAEDAVDAAVDGAPGLGGGRRGGAGGAGAGAAAPPSTYLELQAVKRVDAQEDAVDEEQAAMARCWPRSRTSSDRRWPARALIAFRRTAWPRSDNAHNFLHYRFIAIMEAM